MMEISRAAEHQGRGWRERETADGGLWLDWA